MLFLVAQHAAEGGSARPAPCSDADDLLMRAGAGTQYAAPLLDAALTAFRAEEGSSIRYGGAMPAQASVMRALCVRLCSGPGGGCLSRGRGCSFSVCATLSSNWCMRSWGMMLLMQPASPSASHLSSMCRVAALELLNTFMDWQLESSYAAGAATSDDTPAALAAPTPQQTAAVAAESAAATASGHTAAAHQLLDPLEAAQQLQRTYQQDKKVGGTSGTLRGAALKTLGRALRLVGPGVRRMPFCVCCVLCVYMWCVCARLCVFCVH